VRKATNKPQQGCEDWTRCWSLWRSYCLRKRKAELFRGQYQFWGHCPTTENNRDIPVTLLKPLFIVLITLGLLACEGYSDDGAAQDDPTALPDVGARANHDFYLQVITPDPGTAPASKLERHSAQASRAAQKSFATDLTRDKFRAVVVVPDDSKEGKEKGGYREVAAKISEDESGFQNLSGGLYLVNIDGIALVDAIIYVKIGDKEYKALLIRAGTRDEPIDVSQISTVVVDTYLDQVDIENIKNLNVSEVESFLTKTENYLEGLNNVDALSPEELAKRAKDCSWTAKCEQAAFLLSGTISGLNDSSIQIQLSHDGANETLDIATNGSFNFTGKLPEGSSYSTSIVQQPADQTCNIENASGNVAKSDVSNIAINCSQNPHQLTVSVNGLAGTLLLTLNGSETQTVTANGQVRFATTLLQAQKYSITASNPVGQTCSVANGAGTINSADIADVTVNCTSNLYHVRATVNGLAGTLPLSLNGTESRSVTANGSVQFATTLLHSANYNVTASNPEGQTCSVVNGTGTINAADVTNVVISCASNPYYVSAAVNGLIGTLPLSLNGSETLSITANGTKRFDTILQNAASYSVTATNPVGQTCTVVNGTGTIHAANVTNVTVNCTSKQYHVNAAVTGLIGTLPLTLNGTETIAVTTNRSVPFTTTLLHTQGYSVTAINPAGQTCAVTNGTGNINAADVNVRIACTSLSYSVGGSVSGAFRQLQLLLNDDTSITLAGDGDFEFDTHVDHGSSYAVTVLEQPSGQQCTVASGNGSINAAAVTDIAVTCVTKPIITSIYPPVVVGGEEVKISGFGLAEVSATVDGEAVTPTSQFEHELRFDAPQRIANQAGYLLKLHSVAGDFEKTIAYATELRGDTTLGQAGIGGGCAVTDSGTVQCWDNGSPPHTVTVDNDGTPLRGVKAIAVGLGHTCALLTKATVQCWGGNSSGQLGNNTLEQSNLPVTVVDEVGNILSGVAAIAAGDSHSCALMLSGYVRCWGSNSSGQLGDGLGGNAGANTPHATFARMEGVFGECDPECEPNVRLSPAMSVSADDNFTCALLRNGTVYCWGSNENGQLGNGSQASSTRAVSVVVDANNIYTPLQDVATVAVGGAHACALMSDSTVKCWGSNSSGQLGGNSSTTSPVPVTVIHGDGSPLTNVTALSSGFQHTCALIQDGSVLCWGSNSSGQLGNASNQASSVPQHVLLGNSLVLSAVAIAADEIQSCALLQNNAVICWGYAGSGYPDGTLSDKAAPHTISQYFDWSNSSPFAFFDDEKPTLAVGKNHSCAFLSDPFLSLDTIVFESAGLHCWGDNNAGQLGNISDTYNNRGPLVVGGLDLNSAELSYVFVKRIVVGDNHSCAILNDYDNLRGGYVQCWGKNDLGQLGNEINVDSSTPVPVSDLDGNDGSTLFSVDESTQGTWATDIAAGANHTCAVINDVRLASGDNPGRARRGEVRCWGDNTHQQLGVGSIGSSNLPITVTGLDGTSVTATAIAAGAAHSCAIVNNNNTVRCWGQNNYGQLGHADDADSSTPLAVAQIQGATAITAGSNHTCVVADGRVFCWGLDDDGQLGDGTVSGSDTPVQVLNIDGIGVRATLVAAGESHTCTVLESGAVICWGDNRHGQLGDGTFAVRTTPVSVAGLDGTSARAVAIAAGGNRTCVVLDSGAIQCWGEDNDGSMLMPTLFTARSTIDFDLDGILDESDNCPYVSNPDQLDTDDNGYGDACYSYDESDGSGGSGS